MYHGQDSKIPSHLSGFALSAPSSSLALPCFSCGLLSNSLKLNWTDLIPSRLPPFTVVSQLPSSHYNCEDASVSATEVFFWFPSNGLPIMFPFVHVLYCSFHCISLFYTSAPFWCSLLLCHCWFLLSKLLLFSAASSLLFQNISRQPCFHTI